MNATRGILLVDLVHLRLPNLGGLAEVDTVHDDPARRRRNDRLIVETDRVLEVSLACLELEADLAVRADDVDRRRPAGRSGAPSPRPCWHVARRNDFIRMSR